MHAQLPNNGVVLTRHAQMSSQCSILVVDTVGQLPRRRQAAFEYTCLHSLHRFGLTPLSTGYQKSIPHSIENEQEMHNWRLKGRHNVGD